jgi:hypothetical protein
MTHEEKMLLEGIKENLVSIRILIRENLGALPLLGYMGLIAIALLGLILWRVW